MEPSYKGEEKFLVNDLKTIVSKARSKAFAAVNYSLVERNWRIGKRIVEEEQNGEARAEYGKHIIEVASAALTEEFGKGFSVTTLRVFRRFYLKFSNLQIQRTVSVEFNASIQQTPSEELSNNLQHVQKAGIHLLPWSHYELLIRIEDKQARDWYAKEAFEQGWSYRTLSRNINTLYYERLLMSKDKAPVEKEMKEKTNEFQQDKLEYIKSPVVMEFLGLPSDSSLKESKLESAIIDNLEKFLMEMGKGYALVARQQHIRTEENDYYIDLVFYNYLIKSFILVDLKVNCITYQDDTSSLFYFEDIRIYREHKNMVNRLNNCEIANQEKTFRTGQAQLENINYLKMHDLFDLLEENTRIVADARVKYPEVSMQELADIITLENNYKIGKSGVNHHFIKINNLVKRHKERSEENGS